MFKFMTFLLALLIPTQSMSADISVQQSKIPIIFLYGDLNNGDDVKFINLAKKYKKAVVLLDSPGGALDAGISIGRAILKKKFATMVAPNSSCASSCALVWLAGNPRMLPAKSKVGFHSVSSPTNPENEPAANALVGAYMRDIGLNDGIIALLMKSRPDSMKWLTAADAAAVGLQIRMLEDNSIKAAPKADVNSRLELTDNHATIRDVAGFYEESGAVSTKTEVKWSAEANQMNAAVEVPQRGYQFIISFNRSHSNPSVDIELRITTRPRTDDRIVSQFQYITMKTKHDEFGTYLVGSSSKIGDDYYIFSITNGQERQANLDLLKLRWMDIVVKFASGKRAILTMRRPEQLDDKLALLFED